MPKRPSHPGLTLIETLAALAILSAASIIALGLLHTRSEDPAAAAAGLRAALERARLLAITEGGGTLMFSSDGTSISFGFTSDESPRTRRVLDLPRPWSIRPTGPEVPMGGETPLLFDHAGRSADASLVLLRGESPRLRLRWLGIAGQLVALEPDSEPAPWGMP